MAASFAEITAPGENQDSHHEATQGSPELPTVHQVNDGLPAIVHSRSTAFNHAPLPPNPFPLSSDTPYIFRGLAARRASAARAWITTLGRWLVTVIFIVAVYGVLLGYGDYDVMSKTQKRQFSALVTGLLIALALLTTSQLNSIVVGLRWWMLSRRARSQRKVSVLLRCHSMGAIVMLALKSRRWTIHAAVTTWVLLLLGSQIAYAAIPLCFSVEKTQNMALLRSGNVSIPNMASIQTTKVISSSESSIKAQQYTANSYGTISLAYAQGDISDIPEPGTLRYSDDYLMFCQPDGTWCSYIFLEINPESLRNPDAIPVTATTNRAVNASSHCSSFPVVQGGNGTQDTIVIDRNGGTIELPLPVRGGLDQSTFMTNISSSSDCGANCGIVSIFEASSSSAWYYNCTTTLGVVTNAVIPEHTLGTNLTNMATTAIALQGFSPETNGVERTQFQTYPSASIYGSPLNGSTTDMAFLLSRFTIGVVAITAEANEDLIVAGNTPHIGQKLTVQHWKMIHLIFGLTAGLQLVFAVAARWVSRRVVNPTGGSVAEAQVLRLMMTDNMDAGKECTKNEGDDEKGSSRLAKMVRDCWIYRDHHVGDGIYDLFMEKVTPCASKTQQSEHYIDHGENGKREKGRI